MSPAAPGEAMGASGLALPREGRLAAFLRSGRAAPYILVMPAVAIVMAVVAIPLLVSLFG